MLLFLIYLFLESTTTDTLFKKNVEYFNVLLYQCLVLVYFKYMFALTAHFWTLLTRIVRFLCFICIGDVLYFNQMQKRLLKGILKRD